MEAGTLPLMQLGFRCKKTFVDKASLSGGFHDVVSKTVMSCEIK